MRHLGSFLLALILAPIVYLLTGLGLSAFGQAAQRGADQRPMATMLALATLVVGGGVYAVLVMARLSPVGPGLAGFFFLGVAAWPVVDPAGYEQVIKDIGAQFNLLGVQILGIDLVGSSGLGVLLAVPLLATLASPRRWSRYDLRPAQVAPAYPAYPPPAYAGPTRYATQQEPVTEQLPDVAPPTLHYPRYSAPVAVPQSPQPPPPAAATVVLPPAAPAPAPPPPAEKQTAPAPPPPAEKQSAPAEKPADTPVEQPAPEEPEPPMPSKDRAADQEISIPRLDAEEPTEPAAKPATE
jgi:hypothetical protein